MRCSRFVLDIRSRSRAGYYLSVPKLIDSFSKQRWETATRLGQVWSTSLEKPSGTRGMASRYYNNKLSFNWPSNHLSNTSFIGQRSTRRWSRIYRTCRRVERKIQLTVTQFNKKNSVSNFCFNQPALLYDQDAMTFAFLNITLPWAGLPGRFWNFWTTARAATLVPGVLPKMYIALPSNSCLKKHRPVMMV